MLDLVVAILLTALAVVYVLTLAPASALRGASRNRFALVFIAWFLVAAALGASGVFSALPVGLPLGIAILVPVLAGSVIVARTRAFGIPLETLIAVNAGRILGVIFLLVFAAGRLPSTFAHSAGWGDIVTGVAAIPVVWAAHRQVAGWRWITALWNGFGMLDLLTAVTLGVGSAPGSPVRFIFETPGSGAIRTFPLALVPAFFVPFYMLTHVAIFMRLMSSVHTRADASRPATLEAVR